jgi:hypothetical protein
VRPERIAAGAARDRANEAGDSWPAFDIGIAAYNRPVTQVRVMRSDGSWEQFRVRRLGRDFGVPGLGSLRYAVFAVEVASARSWGWRKAVLLRPPATGNAKLGNRSSLRLSAFPV